MPKMSPKPLGCNAFIGECARQLGLDWCQTYSNKKKNGTVRLKMWGVRYSEASVDQLRKIVHDIDPTATVSLMTNTFYQYTTSLVVYYKA